MWYPKMSEVTQCIHCPFSDRIGPHGPGPVLVLEVEKESPACQAVLRQRGRTRFVIMVSRDQASLSICILCLAFRARGQGRGEDHSGPGLGHHCSRRNDRSLKWTWTINNTLKRNALVLHHSFCVVATCEEFPSSTMWILLTKLTKTLLLSPLYEYIGLIPSQSDQNHKVSPLTFSTSTPAPIQDGSYKKLR